MVIFITSSIYLVLFIVCGIIVCLLTFFSDLFDSILDALWSTVLFKPLQFLNPVSLFTSVMIFGLVGFVLTTFSSVPSFTVLLVSIAFTLFTTVALYFLITKPRHIAENSLTFSIKELIGVQGIVTVSIPATGFGEVMIKVGGGNTNQIAASFDRVDIKEGTRIFIVEEREQVVYVSEFN